MAEDQRMKIPGVAYLIIGAAMVMMSAIIDPLKLVFFVFVGAVFIVIGFIKILAREKKLKHHPDTYHHVAPHPHHAAAHTAQHQHASHQHAAVQHPAQHHQAAHVQHTSVARCSSCGAKLHHMFKFCPNCGQKTN